MSKSSTFLCKKRAALQWIENVLEVKIDQNKDFNQILEDGVLLCKVMHTISPRLMPRISIPDANTPKSTIRFKYNENISFFIQACADMGVPRHKRFALSDIVNNQTTYTNIKRVIECLEAVCKIANTDPNYEFSVEWPLLEATTEQFSRDEIDHAESLLAQFTIRESKRQEVIKKSQNSQNEGNNSVEATKNQLFQHLAAQKQLYPDNSPQQRVNTFINNNNINNININMNYNHNNNIASNKKNNNNKLDNSSFDYNFSTSPSSPISTSLSSYSSLSSSPVSSVSSSISSIILKDEINSNCSSGSNSLNNSKDNNITTNYSVVVNNNNNGINNSNSNINNNNKLHNSAGNVNNSSNSNSNSNNNSEHFSFKDILKKWKDPSFFNNKNNLNNNNKNNGDNTNNSNDNHNIFKVTNKNNSGFVPSNQRLSSTYNSPYCTIKYKPTTQQHQQNNSSKIDWRFSNVNSNNNNNNNNINNININNTNKNNKNSIDNNSLVRSRSISSGGSFNNNNNNNNDEKVISDDNSVNNNTNTKSTPNIDNNDNNNDNNNSPKTDRNSLSQPVSPLITGNARNTITPDSVSLSSSPNVKSVNTSSSTSTSSPSKPTVVSTATVATNASSTTNVVSSASSSTTPTITSTPVVASNNNAQNNISSNGTTSSNISNNVTPNRQSISKLSLEERAAIRIQKATRRWLERNRQIILARDSAYRERIVQEIKKTEVEYINRLAYLNDVILKDLREAIDKGSPIITLEEVQSIFSEVQIILSYNRRLLSDIESRTKEWKQDTMIGDIFIKFSNFLKIYSQYSRSYSEAMGVLNECKKQSKFKSYLNKIKEQNEEIKLRGLEDYLIRPIQRIPRYSLLIKDMISHTWQTHPDYEQLKQAFDKINLVAENMNEMRKEAESIMKLAEIQEKLDGDNQLAKSHRRFIKEGEFYEVLNKGKKTPIVLYLFNDSLAITRPNKSSGSSFFGKQKTIRLQFEQIIFLHQLVIKEFEGSNNLQIFKEKSFSMLITAPDKDTLNEWIKAISIEKAEYQKTLSDHNDRQMATTIERAEHTKQKIEEKFTGRASGQFTQSEIEQSSTSISSGAPSSDDLASSGGSNSSIDMKSGKMSLRERRLKLAQESKSKRLSGSSSSFTNLNDQNLKDSK